MSAKKPTPPPPPGRVWMAGVYGYDREAELDEPRRSFWIEDVTRCEADVADAVARHAYAAQAHQEAFNAMSLSDDPARREEEASRLAFLEYTGTALLFDVSRLALCRARVADPGDKYALTPTGRKEACAATAAVRPRSGSGK